MGLGSPKGVQKWAQVNREKTSFTAVVHNNSKHGKEEVMVEKIDDDAILPVPADPDFKGIVKTTEYKVEK